jgi:hypothetical protein
MVDIDITWPLDDEVGIRVTRKAGDILVIEDMDQDRQLTLSWNHQTGTGYSRLLFDGQDIETEEYMAYVGLMDTVVEALGDKGIGTVILTDEAITVLEDDES